MEIKKQTVYNICFPTEASFLCYLETLMYSYVLCSMKDEVGSQMLTRAPLVGVAF